MLLYQEIKEHCENLDNKKGFFADFKENNIISKFEREWIRIMVNIGFYNKYGDTYSLNNLIFTKYGVKCDIFIVAPLTFTKIDDSKEIIEESMGCVLLFKHVKGSRFIKADFIFNQKENNEFKIIKNDKPYMVYIGDNYNGKPIFVDLKKYPHILISGTTRSGKSKMEDCIITNSVVNNSPKDLELYLFQVSKSDLVLYEDLEHTKAFSDTLEKTEIALNYLVNTIMVQRDKLIRPYRKRAMADNYHDYNKLGNNNIPTILAIFDETSSLYQNNGEGKYEKEMKQNIVEYIDKLVQYGASLGIFVIVSVQKPTIKNLSSFVKSQCTSNVSFKQSNQKSAEVATDDSKLPLGLKQREFVYHLDNWSYGIVPLINNKEIYNVIKPYMKKHETLFDKLEKAIFTKVKVEKAVEVVPMVNKIEGRVKV